MALYLCPLRSHLHDFGISQSPVDIHIVRTMMFQSELSEEHSRPKAVVLYHFLPPDEVVSAVLFGELSAELVNRGWEVTAFPCNRDCRNQVLRYSAEPNWNGVDIRRLWRPNFAQSTSTGRILNAVWMIARWSVLGCDPRVHPEVLIVGTDPILSILIAVVWRRLKPRTRIVHWCFDLYPEAAIADGILKKNSRVVALLRALVTKAYAACDLIVDIGSCMRALLKRYRLDTRMETLVPWALEESSQVTPIHNSERRTIFGTSGLTLMYSGSLGRAHSFEDILQLARALRQNNVKIAFSVSEVTARALRRSILPGDENVVFIPTVPSSQISRRLSAADICIVTLKEEWTGIVVPSKFFGALSMGRPILFCGSPQSAIAQWINQYEIGWVLVPETADRIVEEMKRLVSSREELEGMFHHCHQVYTEHFSKAVTMNRWDRELRNLLPSYTCPD
jgi:colanic acid biosynthesis glycosyl transferase WcaI